MRTALALLENGKDLREERVALLRPRGLKSL
jgi:hypothetical protein